MWFVLGGHPASLAALKVRGACVCASVISVLQSGVEGVGGGGGVVVHVTGASVGRVSGVRVTLRTAFYSIPHCCHL